MEIKQLVENILKDQQEEGAEILEIFKTGSQIFINNPKDLDYVAVCKNYTKKRTKTLIKNEEKWHDIIIIDEQALKSVLDFNDKETMPKDLKFFNYFFEKNIRQTVYGGVELGWSMLEHKKEYLDVLKEKFNRFKYKDVKNVWKIGKIFVHYYVVYYMIKNNKVEITEKMKADIEKIYSGSPASELILLNLFSRLETL